MEAHTTDEEGSLGPRLRALRTQRGLTLVQLAGKSGLSHPFLSQLERGRARPSMTSLERIAAALSTSVVELLADQPSTTENSRVSVVHAGEGIVGGFGSGTGRVLVDGAPRSFRPIEYSGDSAVWGEVVVHDEDEFLYVLSGQIEIELGGARHLLGPRDSSYCPGGTGHRWRSQDGRDYRLIVVKEWGP